MRRAIWMAGLAGVAFTAIASAASAQPDQFARLCGPPGIHFGMSIDDWKALPIPGERPGMVQPVCSDDQAAANYLGVKTAPAPGQPVVCGYANRIGSVFLSDNISVLGGYPASALRYRFPASQLAEIDCAAPDNAFTAAHARFDQLYGPSKKLLRDTVRTEVGVRPRVRETWSIPGGTVTMIDPAQPASDLLLQYKASGS